jgi:hypothetical protein
MKHKRAEHYRNFAKQCLLWAKQARTDLERRDFLDMAEASRRAAAEYEGVPDWVNNSTRDEPPTSAQRSGQRKAG